MIPASMSNIRQGLVVRTDAKVCHVEVDGRVQHAVPRGILFDGEQRNPVAVGDQVEIDLTSVPASLDRVLPRKNWLSRIANSHDPREQVLAANVDQLFAVASVANPKFSSNRTDRIFAACMWQRIPTTLILNKIDLGDPDDLAAIRATYEAMPIEVLETCASDGRGIEAVRERMAGRTTIFYGASGAGKSSLLNGLQPSLKLKVGKISRYWDQGKHTTSFSQIHTLAFDARVIDTPGIRVFRPFGVPIGNLRDLFPEIVRYQVKCRFNGCSHDHEPECAVFDAVDRGDIAASRYASYVEMLDEVRTAKVSDEEDDAAE
ncbi:MAG: ribosome small subunit-dependent GTPase A [Planctomycetota bacterium]|nr:ribosome small subunit-dependent GTPase A [Planctomycetota bacterium]